MSTLLSFTALAAATRRPKFVLPSKAALKRTVLGLALVAALGFAGERGYDYWTVGRFQVSTDDAYVRANNTTLGASVSGHLAAILVGDNAPVRAGEVVYKLDDGDYRIAVDAATTTIATQ